MSHEIRTPAGNRVYSLLLTDRADEIEEEDIVQIEREARAGVDAGVSRLQMAENGPESSKTAQKGV